LPHERGNFSPGNRRRFRGFQFSSRETALIDAPLTSR